MASRTGTQHSIVVLPHPHYGYEASCLCGWVFYAVFGPVLYAAVGTHARQDFLS